MVDQKGGNITEIKAISHSLLKSSQSDEIVITHTHTHTPPSLCMWYWCECLPCMHVKVRGKLAMSYSDSHFIS